MIERLKIETNRAELPGGPYSQALIVGEQVFISGQIGADPALGTLVEGGCLAQTEQVMRNLSAVLEACGCTFANVVKATIFLREFEYFPQVNAIYERYLEAPYPTRSTIGVTHLAANAAIEIELWAIRG